MTETDFLGTVTTLADADGASIRTGPNSALPVPGRSVLLDTPEGWRLATVERVLAQASSCGFVVSIVRLQSATTPV